MSWGSWRYLLIDYLFITSHLGISKNMGKPQNGWWTYQGKPYWNGMIWGVFPLFLVQHPFGFFLTDSRLKRPFRRGSLLEDVISQLPQLTLLRSVGKVPFNLWWNDPKILEKNTKDIYIYIGCCPLPVTVTTRIITFLIGNPYKPSFATVTGRGHHPTYTHQNLTSKGNYSRSNR